MLLGEPGSGKTTVFRQEAEALGLAAIFATAKDFLTLHTDAELLGKILFIDALDERRSDVGGTEGPLETIRSKLRDLGRPTFRLACREADWYQDGSKDLARVSPDGTVVELRLDALSDAQTRQLLSAWLPNGSAGAGDFVDTAEQHNLDALLQSPLLLKLLVDAVSQNDWPANRSQVYELACTQMALEQNPVHRRLSGHGFSNEQVLSAAGLLSAMLLLSDSQSICLDPSDRTAGSIQLTEISDSLGLTQELLRTVLDTKLFSAEGEHRSPLHRTIAEYLGARSLSKQVQSKGLPLLRLLALMTADDGCVVDPLRGLYGWLCLHCETDRAQLVNVDPLALVLYGDVGPYSSSDRRLVLRALKAAADRFPWFRNDDWAARPFGALGSPDLIADFALILRDPARGLAHEPFLACVIDALIHGSPIPALATDLYAVVTDSTYTSRVRRESAAAWLNCTGNDSTAALQLLSDIRTGDVLDDDDEISGRLLDALFPVHMSAQQALESLHGAKAESLIGWYHMFWADDFVARIPKAQIADALDQLLKFTGSPEVQEDSEQGFPKLENIRKTALSLLNHGLNIIGDESSDQQLFNWLGLGIDKYGQEPLHSDVKNEIVSWLGARPERMKGVYQCGVDEYLSGDATTRRPWAIENRLYSASRPVDWLPWVLERLADWGDEELAKHWFQHAAWAVMNEQAVGSINLEYLESWVRKHIGVWPTAEQWLEERTSLPLDSWDEEEHRRKVQNQLDAASRRANERAVLAPFLPGVFAGTAPAHVMGKIAIKYKQPPSGNQGRTATERVANYLCGTPDEAAKAISALTLVLGRRDLNTRAEVISSFEKGERFWLSYACLLAAELAWAQEPTVFASISASALEALIAYHLIDEGGRTCGWFKALCMAHPDTVHRVSKELLEADLRVDPPRLQLYFGLPDDDASREFVALLLPDLLMAIPSAPTSEQLRIFNSCLIRAAKKHLAPETLQSLLAERLKDERLSIEFFAALQIAALTSDPELHLLELKTVADVQPDIGLAIRRAFVEQREDDSGCVEESIESAGLLIELLAECAQASNSLMPHESEDPFGEGCRLIHNLAKQISDLSSPLATKELMRLRALPAMGAWRTELDWYIGVQQKLARSISFVAPNATEVGKVLCNLEPANARDMAILLIEKMMWLAKRIRSEETNQLLLFWEKDSKGVLKPKSENSCRDVLHGLLRDSMLPLGVQVEKEAMAAADKRADLQANTLHRGARIVVPVEIKKESHSEVWTAWVDQLEARYTSNPGAQGIGVYLVFWFGDKPKRHPDGTVPRNAEHMAELLGAAIPKDRWNRIFGLVIDLSARA